MSDPGDSIIPLDQLPDFEIAEGDPDVRGWAVVCSDGREIGEVDDVLVDTSPMKVRYLDVALVDELLAEGEARHILVPIEYARLDETDDQIFVDRLSSDRLPEVPSYDSKEALTAEYEAAVRSYFDTARASQRQAGEAEGIEGPGFMI